MTHDKNDEDYISRIDAQLQMLSSRGRRPDFPSLLSDMRGAPPEVVLGLVCIDTVSLTTTLRPPWADTSLAPYEPHPLDYDWPFTPDCATQLAGLIADGGPNVALFGMPNVHRLLIGSGFRATLVDRNPLAALHAPDLVLSRDICEPGQKSFPSTFDTVFMDAPWYPEILLAWLECAFLSTRDEGTIWFSLWGELTRPNAAHERECLFESLSSRGRFDLYADELRYDIPLFEYASFEAAGVTLNRPWRTGDLVRFQKAPSCHLPPRPRLESQAEWYRFNLDNRQVAVRRQSENGAVGLEPIGAPPSCHLSSVSRRDPSRCFVDLWLSNNCVAKLSGSQHFIEALTSLGKVQNSRSLSVDGRRALSLMEKLGLPRLDNKPSIFWRHHEWISHD